MQTEVSLENSAKNRNLGVDLARCLALLGMIILHFDGAMDTYVGPILWPEKIVWFLQGKASAMFVIVAGIGISLFSQDAVLSGNAERLDEIKRRLLKRAFLLFILGLLFWTQWDADILHFYGMYFCFSVFLLTASSRALLLTTLTLPFLYAFLMFYGDFGEALNQEGALRINSNIFFDLFCNLFFDGLYPVLPWFSFISFGMWFGRQKFMDKSFLAAGFFCGVAVTVATCFASEVLSYDIAIKGLGKGDQYMLFDTDMWPPLPFFMLSAGGFAVAIISATFFVALKYPAAPLLKLLSDMGQMTLTLYIAHILLGLEWFEYLKELEHPSMIYYPFMCAFTFFFFSLIATAIWKGFFHRGPIELLMFKLMDSSLPQEKTVLKKIVFQPEICERGIDSERSIRNTQMVG